MQLAFVRTFTECKEIKAVVSIGCCYNLLSEKSSEKSCSRCGFPMSIGLKSLDFQLGKNARDLGCQVVCIVVSVLDSAALLFPIESECFFSVIY